MRLVEPRTSYERVEEIMAEARVERAQAFNDVIRALGRAIAGAFQAARTRVRRAAGVAEPCTTC